MFFIGKYEVYGLVSLS